MRAPGVYCGSKRKSIWGGRGDIDVAPATRIWHRNYYEVIVRTPEAEKSIREYIRMNPWRCVCNLGKGLRGMLDQLAIELDVASKILE